jgi:hypothetical protein
MKRIVQLLVAVVACCLAPIASAVVILDYPFNNDVATPVPNPSTYASGTAPANFGVSVSTASGTYLETKSYNGYTSPTPSSQSTYWSITVTPTAAYNVQLTSVNVVLQNSPTKLSSIYAAVYLGGATAGSTPLFGAAISGVSAGSQSFTFSGALLSANTAYEIRFFGNGSSGFQSEALNFDSMQINGTENAVPEPVNIALALFALGGTGVYAGRCWLRRK